MISENIQKIQNKITDKCIKVGRNPSEITLIAVSKNFGIDKIIEASNSGLVNFGENKAQEFVDKAQSIDKKLVWHFIGHLQTNKVKYVVKNADYIHSVDSLKLAEEIEKQAGKINKLQKILLEIKTSDEATKFGLTNEEEILNIASFCKNAEHLDLVGLMTIAPFTDNETDIRKSFSFLRELKIKLNALGFGLKELSMGMTNDFEIAIEEGSTMLRIGTAIFGKRNYN